MNQTTVARRSFLYSLGASLGSVAFSNILAEGTRIDSTGGPLAPKPPMLKARAKNVIMLFMEGDLGHMDTFDPKPALSKLHKEESKLAFGQETGFKFYVGSPFRFRKVGNNGIDMCDQWEQRTEPELLPELRQ